MKGKDDYLSKEREEKSKYQKNGNKWILYVFIITFILSITFGGISNVVIGKLNIIVACILLIVIVAIGIVFDMIGMSVVTCNESSFHAKAAKKKNGAKEAGKLLTETNKTKQ